jgi:L-malate glycosyltransferase
VTIKVLFLHVGENWIRGSENALLTLLRGLDRSKFTPFLLCDQPALLEAARKEGIVASLGRFPNIMLDSDTLRLDFFQWFRMSRTLRSLIRENGIQVLYSNSARPCQVAHYVARWNKLPLICHLHASYNRRYVLLYRLGLVTHLIFPSHAVEDYLRRKQPDLPPSDVVYFGPDPSRFHPPSRRESRWRDELGIPADAIAFGEVAFLVPEKGVETLLRAFQIVNAKDPRVHLVLVGDGPLRQKLADLARELSLETKVHFTGYQPEPERYYQHVFDVNVLASRKEALGISAVEAAACGLPCIGANVEGIPETIEGGVSGMLFESGNQQELAVKMLEMAARPELRRTMGEAGRRLVEQRFSRRAYIESIQRIILKCAAKS